MRSIYRLLLKLYPARFREEFSAPLDRQFADEHRDAGTAGERVLLYLRAFADLAVTIPREILREAGQDLRYAARVYRKRGVATAMAFGALALAIGATTGVFSVVNALLIRSLPFRQPERLVHATNTPVSPLDGRAAYFAWRDSRTYLQDAAAYFPARMNLALADRSAHVPVAEVSANFFALLGAEPIFGRAFRADEDHAGRDGVAVIGYAVWQELFGGNPGVLGATIHLNGVPMEVIGVAPPTLDFPKKTAVWTPTIFDTGHLRTEGVVWGETVARLKNGASTAQAARLFDAEMQQFHMTVLTPLLPLQSQLAGPIRQASLVLFGLVAFVLLIACANVAHLLLSRVAERRQELVIRNSLGASRARLVQQLVTESLLLTAAAACAGLAVARWASRLASAAQPAQLSTQDYAILDWRVLAFAAGTALLTGVLFGVLPALLVGRMQSGVDALRSRSSSQFSGAGRMRGALLAVQGGLALVLLAGSLAMGRSFLRLMHTDLGFQTDHTITLNVTTSGSRWEGDSHSGEYPREALERLRAIPGVESAGAVDYLPLMENMFMAARFTLDESHSASAVLNAATPDYFRSMSARLLEGRDFGASEKSAVAIVNQEFTRQLGIGPHVVGRTIITKWPSEKPMTIIGVVETALTRGPDSKPIAQVFLPVEKLDLGFLTFVARVHGDPEPYLPAARAAIQQVDREVPVYDVKTLGARLNDLLVRPRFYTTATLFLAGFALLLAIVGIYGAASYAIAQRTHEIGVRIAVGATPRSVRGLLLRQSLLPMAIGSVAGVAAAALFGRYLEHLITGADATGSVVAGAAIALGAATALAVWMATGRIVRMDPASALRAE